MLASRGPAFIVLACSCAMFLGAPHLSGGCRGAPGLGCRAGVSAAGRAALQGSEKPQLGISRTRLPLHSFLLQFELVAAAGHTLPYPVGLHAYV